VHQPPIRVVVVDDHALHRDGTRQILAQHTDLLVVGEAHSGEVAMSIVNQQRPDVVLMDIGLPGMSGVEAARRIHTHHPDVRVLMVTGYDEDEYVRGALEAGATGYIRKTAPGRELVDAIRAVADGATVLQAGLAARVLSGRRVDTRSELTDRELEVLSLLVSGLHNKEVATRLFISPRTVERHCNNLYAKLGVGSRSEAIVRALTLKLVTVGDVRG
jgi:DNA-binding NarL/FixJ family response regulator